MVVFRQQKQRTCQVGICLEQVYCLPLLKQHYSYVENNYSFPGGWPRQSSQVTAFLRCLYFCARVSRLGTEAPLETLISVSAALGCVGRDKSLGSFPCCLWAPEACLHLWCWSAALRGLEPPGQGSLHLFFPLHEESNEVRNLK